MHMLSHRNQVAHISLFTAILLLLYFFAPRPIAAQEAPPGIAKDFVEGANRIIIERIAPRSELTVDYPPKELYYDAWRYVDENGFDIDMANEEELIITTNPGMINDDLYLRFKINVDMAHGGGRLTASAEWTKADLSDWKEASWTEGMAKEAFGEAYMFLQKITHSDMLTGISSAES